VPPPLMLRGFAFAQPPVRVRLPPPEAPRAPELDQEAALTVRVPPPSALMAPWLTSETLAGPPTALLKPTVPVAPRTVTPGPMVRAPPAVATCTVLRPANPSAPKITVPVPPRVELPPAKASRP